MLITIEENCENGQITLKRQPHARNKTKVIFIFLSEEIEAGKLKVR